MVVLSNNYAGVARRIARDVAAMFFGEKYETPPTITPAAIAFDEKLKGRFEVPTTGWKITISNRGGHGVASYTSIRQAALVPIAPDEFFVPMDWSRWKLTRDGDGTITGGTMTFFGDPSPLEFRRVASQ